MTLSRAADTLTARGCAVLTEPGPARKARLTIEAAGAFFSSGALPLGETAPPDEPGRPTHPLLLPPRKVPKRNTGSPAGRIALLHALAHIELNAIDLAWDILCRFGGAAHALPMAFHIDWLRVAADEAKHFLLLERRLISLGTSYGALPAHDGLWAAAARTRHDLLARLAIVPLVHEAHGLDVTPGIAARLAGAGDKRSARLLKLIAREEVSHVRAGRVWFEWEAQRRGLSLSSTFRDLVTRYHGSPPKPPFNHPARAAAGLDSNIYEF